MEEADMYPIPPLSPSEFVKFTLEKVKVMIPSELLQQKAPPFPLVVSLVDDFIVLKYELSTSSTVLAALI